MFNQGNGPPLIVVPGVHGRWEWAKPALQSLASNCRTISYSLCGDIGSRRPLRGGHRFDDYVEQLDEVLDNAGLERAAICGVSFGGLIALRYAAERPERVNALVLASAPGPGWRPNPQQAGWIARPWWSTPAFVLSAPRRLWPEVSASLPSPGQRLGFMAAQGLRCLAAPMIPSLMAARVRITSHMDFAGDCRRVTAPTLVLSGEEGLDRVVPVPSTRAYSALIPQAEYRTLSRTGHMGVLTQPVTFAELVSGFVHAHHH